jgi:hypothetical protein
MCEISDADEEILLSMNGAHDCSLIKSISIRLKNFVIFFSLTLLVLTHTPKPQVWVYTWRDTSSGATIKLFNKFKSLSRERKKNNEKMISFKKRREEKKKLRS